MASVTCRRRRAHVIRAVALSAVITSVRASGATDDWVGHLALRPPLPPVRVYDGAFGDTFNWSTGAVPGSADTAEFNAAQTYTVTFGNNFTNAALTVSDGVVTFAAPGVTPTYTVGSADVTAGLTLSDFLLRSTGAVTVGDSGALTIMSDAQGSGASQLTSGNISVSGGLRLGGNALMTVSGPRASVSQTGSATLTIGSGLLGLGGAGAVDVNNGGKFTTGTGLTQINRNGALDITGGTFTGNGNVSVIGGQISGDANASFALAIGSQFNLTGGGRADFAGPITFTSNSVTVDGATSHFNNSSNTYVGNGGHSSAMVWQNGATGTLGSLLLGGVTAPGSTGTAIIQSGASVTAGEVGVGGVGFIGQVGTLTVTGASSSLTVNGSGLTIGAAANSHGTVNVNSGGTLTDPSGAGVRANGQLSIAGGSYQGGGTLAVIGGTLQSDAAGTFGLSSGSQFNINSGGHVDLSGTITVPGAAITVLGNGSHLNLSHALSLGNGGLTGNLTVGNAATSTVTGGLNLVADPVANGNATALIESGATLTVGAVNIGTGGQSGQAGTLTVTGANSRVIQGSVNTTVGAVANSMGVLQVNAGASYSAGTLQINPTGMVSVSGATLGLAGLTASGGSLQADNASPVNFAESAMVNVQNAGHVDLDGPVSMQAAIVSVSGAGSQFNVAQPVALGNGMTGQNGILSFENSATGNFPGGISLLESFNTTGTASVQSGAQVTAGNLAIGADGNSTNSTPQLVISGAGSSVTQTGAATLNIGTFSTGTSFGLMKVQNGGTFTSGTGATLVDINSTIQVMGGTYHANGDITFRGSTFQQDAAGTFVLAPGKTITFENDAMIDINGSFTGGNVQNEVSMDVSGGNMAVQGFDGAGDVTVAAGAQLTADHIRQGSLTLRGKALVRPQPARDSDSSASSLSLLTIAGAGQLDLADNLLTVHYAAGQSPANMIRSYLVTGFHNGAWDGPGIVSSAANSSHALGFADSADGIVAGLAANTVLVKFTRLGDLNLDGQVNFTDLLALAQHYGQPTSKWDQGDLNYDGTVNFADLLGLAQNYGGTLSGAQLDTFAPSFQSDVMKAFAEVPEPAAVGILFSGALLLRRRSRGTGL